MACRLHGCLSLYIQPPDSIGNKIHQTRLLTVKGHIYDGLHTDTWCPSIETCYTLWKCSTSILFKDSHQSSMVLFIQGHFVAAAMSEIWSCTVHSIFMVQSWNGSYVKIQISSHLRSMSSLCEQHGPNWSRLKIMRSHQKRWKGVCCKIYNIKAKHFSNIHNNSTFYLRMNGVVEKKALHTASFVPLQHKLLSAVHMI